jgi:hypothetical protein
MKNNILNGINSSKTGLDACRVLFDHVFADSPINDYQFEVLSSMFGEAQMAAHALLHLHSIMVLPDSSSLQLAFDAVKEKFIKTSQEVLYSSNPSIDA